MTFWRVSCSGCGKSFSPLQHFIRLDRYQTKTNELEKLVAEKPGQSAYELAPLLTWRIRSRSWEDFPIAQKWFATAEANAHLRYLEREGRIQSELINGVFRFSVK